MEITREFVAENLLWGLWRSVSEDYKTSYSREIWEHFENALRSASYTGSLKVFLTNFRLRIPTVIDDRYDKYILRIVNARQDEMVLNWIRNETTYLTILVRLRNQERKEYFSNIN